MAAKKSSSGAVGTWVGVGVAILGIILTWKWLTAPKAQSSLPGGFVGGAYGGGAAYGQNANTSSSALSNLLKGLGQLLNGQKSGGKGVSFGSGGGSGSSGSQLPQSLQDQIAAIGGFSTIANNTPLSELGGESLNSYDPTAFDQSLVAGDEIAYQPTSLFDLSGVAFDPLGGSTSPQIDLTDTGLSDQTIPYEPMQNLDLSGMAFDPGGDFAAVPGAIGGPDLSSSFNDGPGGFDSFNMLNNPTLALPEPDLNADPSNGF